MNNKCSAKIAGIGSLECCVLTLLIVFSDAVLAEDAFVTDMLQLEMYATSDFSGAPIRKLRSGDRLELLEERGSPQAQFLVQELQADVRAWRLRVQETFQRLSQNPAAGERETFRSKLDGVLDHLEDCIKGALEKAPEGLFSDRDGENFYRLLGAYRGVSEGLVNYAGITDAIDWAQWHEERF